MIHMAMLDRTRDVRAHIDSDCKIDRIIHCGDFIKDAHEIETNWHPC